MLSDVLTDAGRWVKGTEGANGEGTHVGADSFDAVRFCVYGACKKALVLEGLTPQMAGYWDLLGDTMRVISEHTPHAMSWHTPYTNAFSKTSQVTSFNDNPYTSFEDVRLVLKETMADA